MRQSPYIFLIFTLGMFLGCKSAKSLTSTGTLKDNLSAKQILRENQRQTADFKTLQAKVKIDYMEGDQSTGLSITFRMEKDKRIWLSAPFGAARAMIRSEEHTSELQSRENLVCR